MKETVKYKLSKKEYMDIQTYYMVRNSNILKFCVALFVIGIVLLIAEMVSGNKIGGTWILVVFPIPYLAYVVFKIRNIAYTLYDNDIKEWEVTFDDDGVEAKAIKKNKKIKTVWEGIEKIWFNRNYIYIFLSKSVYICIPRNQIKNEEILNDNIKKHSIKNLF